MDDLLISMALAIILKSVKNTSKKTELKAAFLKLFNAIKLNYSDDPNFQ